MARLAWARGRGALWAGGGLIILLAVLVAARTPILRFGVNRFLLSQSGMQIVAADRLSIDPFALAGGSVAFSGSGVQLQHALVPYRMSIAQLSGTAALSGNSLNARYRIGGFDGNLAVARVAGALASASANVGGGGPSQLVLRYAATPGGTPRLMLRGRDTGPLLAALFGRPPAEMASLPAQIDVALAEQRPQLLGLSYRLNGPRLDVAGRGTADLAAHRIVHDGRVRMTADESSKETAANKYGAMRGQIELAVTKIVPLLRTYAVDSRLDLTMADRSGAARYGVLLATNGRPTGPIGHVVLTSSGADIAAAPSMPVADLVIDDGGRAGHLALAGTTGMLGGARRVSTVLDVPAGGHLEPMKVKLGAGDAARGQALDLDIAFREALIGHLVSLEIATKGAIPGLVPAPGMSPMLAILADAVRAIAPGAPALALDGKATLDPEAISVDGFKVAAGSAKLALGGKVGPPDAALSVDGEVAALDQAAIQRLSDVAARFARLPGGASAPPKLDVTGRIGRLRTASLAADGIELRYQERKASARFARLAAAGRPVATDGQVDLAWPLAPGAAVQGHADTQWGRATIAYHPANGRDPAAIASGGGVLDVALTGVKARAIVPAGMARPILVTADLDRAARPMLTSFAGDAIRYVPDEPMKVAATVLPGGSLSTASVDAPSMQVRVAPRGAVLAVTVSGSSARMFAGVPGAAAVLTKDQPVRASFQWRGAGQVQSIDAIDATVGDLHLGGQMRMGPGGGSGRLLVKAAHARTASMLVPSLMTMLPAQTLEQSVVMPLDIRMEGGKFTLVAREATVGPLSISTDVTAEGNGQRMVGAITISGPIADAMLNTLPPWMRDALGPRQTLAARLVVDPQSAIAVRNLRIDGRNASLAGELTIPVRNGGYAWGAASGTLNGAVAGVRYGEFDIPQARYSAVLGRDKLASAKVDLDMRNGGVVSIRLDLDHGQGGRLPAGNIEFVAERVDLAQVCRDTGLRLFGLGRLDATLKGSVPGEIFSNATSGQALFDALMRSAQATGQMRIQDGVLLDIDMTARGRDADGGVGAGERTPFSELAGAVAVSNGVLRLADGRFVTPQYALDVGGGMQLASMMMDFTVRGQVVVVSRASTGQALVKAPIPPLHIVGRPSNPDYEFVPGTARITRAVASATRTAQTVGDKVTQVQAKADKFFSDKLFRPLLGKKAGGAAAPAPAAPQEAAAAPSPAPEPRHPGQTRCGA